MDAFWATCRTFRARAVQLAPAMRHPLLFGLLTLVIATSCQDEKASRGRAPSVPPPGPSNESIPHAQPGNGETSTSEGAQSPQDDAAPPEDPPEPTTPRVDLLGRFDTRDSAGPRCGFPGCRIVARFDGTQVSVRFAESAASWMAGGPSEWDVSIDGVLQPKLVMQLGTKEYPIATGLPAGVHLVELYKRSEAQNGTTQFLGYDFGDGTLLPPPARKKRRIEILGDSQPAAFGIEGVEHHPQCPGLDYSARFQNFHRSMGAVLGEALNAEVAGTVYSGKGIVKDIWRPDTETFPKIFQRALPVDTSSAWDFSLYVPDVVVSMIGGNDFAIGQPTDDGPATLAEFTDGYEALVVEIRSRYPQAHVFLVTSPSVDDAVPEGRATRTNVMTGISTVVARRKNAGDTKVYAVTPPIAAPEELKGCGGHGTPEFHARVAKDLTPIIRTQTGW